MGKLNIFDSFSTEKTRLIVIIVCLATCLITQLIICFQFPVYTDDICNLIMSTRFFEDGAIRPTVMPECQDGASGTPIPLSVNLGHIINSTYYRLINSPLELRIFSLFQYIAWLTTIYFIRKSIFPEEIIFSRLLYFFIPLSGTLPIALTMARQEPTMILILSLTILCFLKNNSSRLCKFALYITPSWLIILHPKTIFFLPVYFYLGFNCFKSKVFKAFYCCFLIITIIQSYEFYKTALSCKENKSLEIISASINKLSSLNEISYSPFQFLSHGIMNIAKQLTTYATATIYYDWTGIFNFLGGGYTAFKIFHSFILLTFLFFPIQKAIRAITLNNPPSSPTIISYLLFGCLLCYSFCQNFDFFYSSTFLFLIFFIAGIMVGPIFKPQLKQNPLILPFVTHALFSTLICLIWLNNSKIFQISNLWESILPSTFNNGFISSNQNHHQNNEVIRAANICKIDMNTSKRLLIDESTYFALKNNRLPVMTRYTWKSYREEYPKLSFPKDLHIFSGFIAKCKFLPEEIKNEAEHVGEYCCKAF